MRPTRHTRDLTPRIVAILAIAMLICVTGCAAERPRVVERDDVAITNDVRERLAADAQTGSLKITVETKAGVVHLAGSVPTDSDRDSVARIAGDAPGVRAVENNVRFGDFN